jgi:hypothetical protein
MIVLPDGSILTSPLGLKKLKKMEGFVGYTPTNVSDSAEYIKTVDIEHAISDSAKASWESPSADDIMKNMEATIKLIRDQQ